MTSAYDRPATACTDSQDRGKKTGQGRAGKGNPDVSLAFRSGAKFTILRATNGFAREQKSRFHFLCSNDKHNFAE